ncbi:MAG: NAD-dependent epimerase/dehydratase family protein [Candidatus Margulisiibacteriota bacterium]|jgi:CDP-glucose 4,6-dehydratase
MQNNNFWFGKRVLITGADGFVASHLIKELLQKNAIVVGTIRHKRPLSTLTMINDNNTDAPVPDVEQCNLLDINDIRRLCDRHQIDTIFHLAASAIVSDAANSPMTTIENNVLSTLNILETARINKIPRVLIASSDKSYGDHATDDLEKLPYKEDYALRGLDIYSASKVCTDMLAQTYAFQFKLKVLITRSCNIYGPGDLNFTRLVPRTIMSLLADKPPVINLGNENVLREYIYVKDVINAYTFLAENLEDYYGLDSKNMPKTGKAPYGWAAFNIGTYTEEQQKNLSQCDNIKSVVDVISLLSNKIKDIKPIIIEKPANFIEIPNQFLDASKIMSLGFRPQINFVQGIAESIKWYRDNFSYLEKIAAKYINR